MSYSRARKKPEPLEEAALYDYAVKALGRRMRTVAELKRLMRSRVEEGDSGEVKMLAVVARLHEHRYLDDNGVCRYLYKAAPGEPKVRPAKSAAGTRPQGC